jgi:tetratricopeptide (TPR) repeat protein
MRCGFAVALVLVLPLTSIAQPKGKKPSWVGETVILWYDREHEGTALNGNAAFDPKFMNYQVQAENGDSIVIRDRGQDYRIEKDIVLLVSEAEAHYTGKIRQNNNDVWAYYGRSVARMELGDLEGALKDNSTAVGFFPNSSVLRSGRASKYRLLKNPEKALLDYNQAISLDPSNDIAVCYRGSLYVSLKKYDLAMLDFGTAARIDPRFVEPVYFRGKVHEARGKYLNAIFEYDAALRIDAKHPETLRAKALLRAACPEAQERNGMQAVTVAKEACAATFWKDGYAVAILAMAHAEARNFPEALKQLDRVPTLDQKWADANSRFLEFLREEFREKRPYRTQKN